MKFLAAFIVGALAGFGLAGLLFSAPAQPVKAREAAPVATQLVQPAEGAASGEAGSADAAPASPPPAELAVAPARSRPRAFLFPSVFSGAPSTRDMPPEDVADPHFAELYQRAVRARARDEFAPYVPLLNLTPQQFDRLVQVGVEQALAGQALMGERMDRSMRMQRLDELSALAEAQLATVLAPSQLETMAALPFSMTARNEAELLDGFAARNAPLSPGQVSHMWVTGATSPRLPQGRFMTQTIRVEAAEAVLTPEQRRLVASRKRWEEAARLRAALASASVRDPDLFDIWPGR